MKKTLKIGLTGGIGAGKSLVLKLLGERGVPVLQTDLIGHRLLKKKSFARIMVKRFGKNILGRGDEVDRGKLAREIFGDRLKQRALNRLSHPLIRKEVAGWIRKQEKRGHSVVVVEVPLLFERGYFRSFNGVLCVSASKGLRHKRLFKRGWDAGEIRRREKFQWPQNRKNRAADWVIFNQSTRKDLKYAVNRWLEKVR